MASNTIATLNQESDLINSDLEEQLLKEIKFPPEMINLPSEYIDFDEMYNTPPSIKPKKEEQTKEVAVNSYPPPTGSFPCTDDYKGPYDFELFLGGQTSKKNSWEYSVNLHKVYLAKDRVLLVQFKINKAVSGLRIRALLVYNTADERSLPVNRCALHSIGDDGQHFAHKDKGTCLCVNYKWVGHVIRSTHKGAMYEYDSQSGRHSVTVPLDAFQPGCDTVTVPYHFTCLTSCHSVISRKPYDVIFTLEAATGEVIGRQGLPVKICSCPKRDKTRDEGDARQARGHSDTPLPSGKTKLNRNTDEPEAKKVKVEESPELQNASDETNNTQSVSQLTVAQFRQRFNDKIKMCMNLVTSMSRDLHNIGFMRNERFK